MHELNFRHQGFGYFRPAMFSPSFGWFLENTLTVQENSAGLCTFDIQLDTYFASNVTSPIPRGTCQMDINLRKKALFPMFYSYKYGVNYFFFNA